MACVTRQRSIQKEGYSWEGFWNAWTLGRGIWGAGCLDSGSSLFLRPLAPVPLLSCPLLTNEPQSIPWGPPALSTRAGERLLLTSLSPARAAAVCPALVHKGPAPPGLLPWPQIQAQGPAERLADYREDQGSLSSTPRL